MEWSKQTIYCLAGTSIELHPEYGSGLWWVINRNRPGKALTSSALSLKAAKISGEWHAKRLALRKRK